MDILDLLDNLDDQSIENELLYMKRKYPEQKYEKRFIRLQGETQDRINNLSELIGFYLSLDIETREENLSFIRKSLQNYNVDYTSLPIEIKEKILGFLNIKELKNARLVNTEHKQIVDNKLSLLKDVEEIIQSSLLDKIILLPYFNMQIGIDAFPNVNMAVKIKGKKYNGKYVGNVTLFGSIDVPDNGDEYKEYVYVEGKGFFDDNDEPHFSVTYWLQDRNGEEIISDGNMYTYHNDHMFYRDDDMIVGEYATYTIVETDGGPMAELYEQ